MTDQALKKRVTCILELLLVLNNPELEKMVKYFKESVQVPADENACLHSFEFIRDVFNMYVDGTYGDDKAAFNTFKKLGPQSAALLSSMQDFFKFWEEKYTENYKETFNDKIIQPKIKRSKR